MTAEDKGAAFQRQWFAELVERREEFPEQESKGKSQCGEPECRALRMS